MFIHQFRANADIGQTQAGQCCDVGVGLRIQASGDEVDDFDLAIFPGPSLEKLFFPGFDRSRFELPLDDLETLINLVLLGAGAVPAEQKLDHIGRHWKLAAKRPDQILPDQVPL